MADEQNTAGERDDRRLPRFGGPVLYPNLYTWIVLFSALDVLFTSTILVLGGSEVNPIAHALLERWGMLSLVVLKFVVISFVLTICEIVGRMRYVTGLRLAWFGLFVSIFPVVAALVQLIAWAWF